MDEGWFSATKIQQGIGDKLTERNSVAREPLSKPAEVPTKYIAAHITTDTNPQLRFLNIVTRVNAEQASKRVMREPTCLNNREGRRRGPPGSDPIPSTVPPG